MSKIIDLGVLHIYLRQKKKTFRFATGGTYCISQALMRSLELYFRYQIYVHMYCACVCCVLCVCVCACVCACMRVHMDACMCVCVRACVRACMCIWMRACVCACMCIYMKFMFIGEGTSIQYANVLDYPMTYWLEWS